MCTYIFFITGRKWYSSNVKGWYSSEREDSCYYWLYTLQQSTVCLWCLLRPVHFIMSYSSTSCIINFTSNPGPSRTTESNVNVVHEACMLDNGGDRVEDAAETSGTTPHLPRPTGVTVYKENTNCTGLASCRTPEGRSDCHASSCNTWPDYLQVMLVSTLHLQHTHLINNLILLRHSQLVATWVPWIVAD